MVRPENANPTDRTSSTTLQTQQNMLATSSLPFFTPSATHTNYLPSRPSPLSPRSSNIHGRRNLGFMSSPGQPSDRKTFMFSHHDTENRAQDDSQHSLAFNKRPVKQAPLPKQNELKERRRSLFLNRVRDGRDQKRFEARGEDMMRLDFVQRKKQWEAERARDAAWMGSYVPEEEEENQDQMELPTSSNAIQFSQMTSQLPPAEEQIDEVLQMEDEEVEALLAYMPVEENQRVDQDTHSDHLWSDDDDYDALFSEFMDQSGGGGSTQQEHLLPQDEEMDLS